MYVLSGAISTETSAGAGGLTLITAVDLLCGMATPRDEYNDVSPVGFISKVSSPLQSPVTIR